MAELPQILSRPNADIPALAERCHKHFPAERFRCLEHWICERIRYGLTSPLPAADAAAASVRRRHLQGLYRLLDEVRRARSMMMTSNASVPLLFEQIFIRLAQELESLRSAPRRS